MGAWRIQGETGAWEAGIGLAAVIVLGACAGAGMDDFDPAQIRVITPTFATSGCIGLRTTPICAIESTIGCSNHLRNSTCGYKDHSVYAQLRANKDRVEYVIVKSGFANPEKVRAVPEAEWKKHPDFHRFLMNGAFQAKVLDRACPATRPDCEGVPWRMGLFNVVPDKISPDLWTPAMVLAFGISDWFVD